jgi:Tol biopolymer transport system component
MKHARLFLMIVSFVLSVTLTIIAQERKADVLLQSGKIKESVEGDLTGAIALYERAVQQAQAVPDRALVVKAQLRLGLAYKKVGDRRAKAVLDQVVIQSPNATDVAQARAALISLADARRRNELSSPNSTELVDKLIWQDSQTETSSRVSFDGRYLSFVDSSHGGALSIRELATGRNREIVGPMGGQIGLSAMSRSGSEIAYAFRPSPKSNGELWVVGIDGAGNRMVYSNQAIDELRPTDWTPDGGIVVLSSGKDGISQIAIVDPVRSRINKLKNFVGDLKPDNMTTSMDGHFILFDAPQGKDPAARDVFTLSSDGGFVEYTVVNHAANDTVLGWISDSKVLFASDRGGVRRIWAMDTISGKPSNSPPVQLIPKDTGIIRPLGTTRNGSFVYSASGAQVHSLENVVPELARLQLEALRQTMQSALPKPGSIEGVIMKRGTNEPIPGAEVELTRIEGPSAFPLSAGAAEAFARLSALPGSRGAVGPDLPPALEPEVRYATTGDNGRFVFRNLKPGGYRIVAALSGEPFFQARYGQRDPRGLGLTLPLAEGQNITDAKMEMAPTGVITGRVYDSQGNPLGHARVLAVYVMYRNGQRILKSTQRILSDERGDYRLFGLPPGRYSVAAIVEEKSEVLRNATTQYGIEEGASPVVSRRILSGGQLIEETEGLVYYGDVTDPNLARTIEVGLTSSPFAGADIHLIVGKTRSYHIRGVLTNGVTGEPLPGVQIRAVPLRQASRVVIPAGVTDSKGSFDLAGVVTGSYSVFSAPVNYIAPAQTAAGQPAPGASEIGQRGAGPARVPPVQLTGNTLVEVGGTDIENLKITTSGPSSLSGRVVIDGRLPEEKATELSKIRVVLSWNPDIVGMPNPSAAFGDPVAGASLPKDGNFRIQTRAGVYRVSVDGLPENGYIKSMRMAEADVLADGLRLSGDNNLLEIVVTEQSGELQGRAVNANAMEMSNVVVALIPDSLTLRQRPDLYRSAMTDATGNFKLKAIPPGPYKLYSWEYAEPGAWQDPQFVQEYETLGTPIRISEGRNQDLEVKVIPKQRSR